MMFLKQQTAPAYTIPVYPLKNPALTTSDAKLQEGLRTKAWWKIHGVAQQILKIKIECKPPVSVKNRMRALLSEKEGLKEQVMLRLLSERTELQEQIDQVQKWKCDQFFKDMKTSGQRFEQESIDRCVRILETL